MWHSSRVILTYLTAAYSKDDTLYPRDIRVRALVDQRLQFDLSTLYARTVDYFVSIFGLFGCLLVDGAVPMVHNNCYFSVSNHVYRLSVR